MPSRFFRQKRQHRLRSTVPKVCDRCGIPLPRANVHNALWQAGEHTGYLCSADKCHEGVAKLE